MKNLIIVLITTFTLQGCLWQSVRPVDIKAAQSFCSDKGGVHSIDSLWMGKVELYCKNRYGKESPNGKKIDWNYTTTKRYLAREYVK